MLYCTGGSGRSSVSSVPRSTSSQFTAAAVTTTTAAAAAAAGAGLHDGVELLHVDWVQELPEDLDVCIAQRDFEAAVDLIQKSIFTVHVV